MLGGPTDSNVFLIQVYAVRPDWPSLYEWDGNTCVSLLPDSAAKFSLTSYTDYFCVFG